MQSPGKSMKRYKKLKKILQDRRLFKLVCGAGNENIEEVRRLSIVFTLAGSKMLDLSANVDVVKAAAEGVEKAYELAPLLNRKIGVRPYLNVSVGLKGDPHVRKANIEKKKCGKCGKCINVCKQNAIASDFVIGEYRCIGCGHCKVVCAYGAIRYINKRVDIDKVLPLCIEKGVETLELHASVADEGTFLKDWKVLNKFCRNNFISLCIDRSLLSDKCLIERIEKAYKLTGERLIVQADGIPMSGGKKDNYNNTLQAVACADIVQKSGIPVKILLSGGTNSKTGLLAEQCGVVAHGISMGSFARRIMKEFIKRKDVGCNIPLLREAVAAADRLIKVNIGAISGKAAD